MYKVYVNSLVNTLAEHSHAISINCLRLTAPLFADDVTLFDLLPTFLKVFMNICHQFSVTWRYEFNNLKSGVMFGKAKSVHSRLLTEREWLLGETTIN